MVEPQLSGRSLYFDERIRARRARLRIVTIYEDSQRYRESAL